MTRDKTLNSWQKKICVATALLVAGAALCPLGLLARTASRSRPKSTSVRKSHLKKRSTSDQASRSKTSKKVARNSSRRRSLTHRQLRARVHLESDRVGEIQQALNKAGYLNEEPTGRWDDSTRSAMRHYQSDHGFPATGLPEAKTLMKLGLGPHPLPPDLDPSVTARANAESTTPPTSQAPPENSPTVQPENK